MRKSLILPFTFCLFLLNLSAQENQMKALSYHDLSNFEEQAGNWLTVGEVTINPTIYSRTKDKKEAGNNQRKKKRRKKAKIKEPKAITYKEGNGILLNTNNEIWKSHLVTNWEHGDLIFETEVMLPKGSNSGIYLQGRYEIQLFDSWGVKNPTFRDIGGIYKSLGRDFEKIYKGKPPHTNAAFAPGVWQHLKIAFKAPRFDEDGKKIVNAKFVSVDLNGVRIHENVEVPTPTRDGLATNEVAMGPIMIQGDHGPIAFRNTRYKLMKPSGIELQDMTYEVYHGNFKQLDEYLNTEIVLSGSLPSLTHTIANKRDQFAIRVKGMLKAPNAGTYLFNLKSWGGIRLKINGTELLDKQNPSAYVDQMVEASLNAGENPFELIYGKAIGWEEPTLGLFDINSFPRPLHDFSSYASAAPTYSPIYINPENAPKMLRAFYDYEGEKSRRLTHTIGVGSPEGTHYIYDLKRANLVCVWRGEFIDATPMWKDRGDGSFRPHGAKRELYSGASFAKRPLAPATPFPDLLSEEDGFQNKGYKIHPDSGYPIFLYAFDNLDIQDHITPTDEGRSLHRKISVENTTSEDGLLVKLAEADTITQLETGEYSLGQRFYIVMDDGQAAQIRTINEKQELVAPLSAGKVEYKIIW